MLNSQHKVQNIGFVSMGKWAFEIWIELFLKTRRPQTIRFFRGSICYQCIPWKNQQESSSRGEEEKSTTVSKNIFVKMSISNLAENTEFLAESIFNSSANFGLLMVNDSVLESCHQGETVFDVLAGVRETYINNAWYLCLVASQQWWRSWLRLQLWGFIV